MKTVPEGRSDAVGFFQSHIAKWVENADQIGSNPTEMAALQGKINDARAAFTAQQEARYAAQTATAAFNRILDELRVMGSSVISKIRATAQTDGSQVYVLAGVSAPTKPAPLGAPGQPFKFDAQLQNGGWLNLSWKCKNPRNAAGTMYKIDREIDGGGFVYIGSSGVKRFNDRTIPAGAKSIVYRITALRSTAVGIAATFPVSFGGTTRQTTSTSIQLANPRRLRRAA